MFNDNRVLVLDHLTKHGVIFEDVAKIMFELDSDAPHYENLITTDNLEPTLFIKMLVRLTGYRLHMEDSGDFILEKVEEYTT